MHVLLSALRLGACAGFQTPQLRHAEAGGQGLSSAASLALQQEPCSPSAVATPVLFGGPRAQAHTREPSRGDAEMWEGGDVRDLGAELFSNLSVACSMSPSGETAPFNPPILGCVPQHFASADRLV